MRNPALMWVVVAVVIAAVIALLVPGDKMQRLELAIGYGLAILIFLFGFVILVEIATGKIEINTLLSESGGGASMSRFQLLIFTFVIALSFFLIVARSHQFPNIPADVLALLGISATTYGVSKGIQAGSKLPPKKATANGDGEHDEGH